MIDFLCSELIEKFSPLEEEHKVIYVVGNLYFYLSNIKNEHF